MKTNYSSSELYHLWANGRVPEGARFKAGSVSACGGLLYSYGECIGILSGGGAIVSSYTWSKTTTKHQYKARQAVARANLITLPCQFPYSGGITELARNARERAAYLLRHIDAGNKARTINATMRAEYAEHCALLDYAHTVDGLGAAVLVDSLADLRALRDGLLVQDCKTRLDNRAGALANVIAAGKNILKKESWYVFPSTLGNLRNIATNCQQLQADYEAEQIAAPDYLSKLPAQARKLLPKLEALHALREAEQMRINADKIARWHAGESVHLPRELPPMLRIEGEQIATSWGARVPVSEAAFLWTIITDTIASGEGMKCHLPAGGYTLERVNADGSIVVGCHVIAYSELASIAKQLNFI